MNFLSNNAGMIGLLFFFLVFLCVLIWALNPKRKERFETYGQIPLKDEDDE